MTKIKKSIIVTVALLAVSAAVASNHGNYSEYKGCSKQKEYKDCSKKKYKKYHKDMRKTHRGDNTRFFIGAVYSLELSQTQENKIKKIIKDFEDQRFKPFDAFTKENFNKDAYIKARSKTKEDRIKAKADLMESIYTVLNKEQKEQLKEELDDFKKTTKRRKDGSSCNGRR